MKNPYKRNAIELKKAFTENNSTSLPLSAALDLPRYKSPGFLSPLLLLTAAALPSFLEALSIDRSEMTENLAPPTAPDGIAVTFPISALSPDFKSTYPTPFPGNGMTENPVPSPSPITMPITDPEGFEFEIAVDQAPSPIAVPITDPEGFKFEIAVDQAPSAETAPITDPEGFEFEIVVDQAPSAETAPITDPEGFEFEIAVNPAPPPQITVPITTPEGFFTGNEMTVNPAPPPSPIISVNPAPPITVETNDLDYYISVNPAPPTVSRTGPLSLKDIFNGDGDDSSLDGLLANLSDNQQSPVAVTSSSMSIPASVPIVTLSEVENGVFQHELNNPGITVDQY